MYDRYAPSIYLRYILSMLTYLSVSVSEALIARTIAKIYLNREVRSTRKSHTGEIFSRGRG